MQEKRSEIKNASFDSLTDIVEDILLISKIPRNS